MSKTKVLIAEDDIDLGNLLKQYLELNGFEVLRVYNGEEARAALKINAYDIAVIDVMMPKEDGFTLASKLKQQYPGMPFLFVTARKLKEDILHGLRLGADDYMVKPFDVDELILRMQNILSRSKPDQRDQSKTFEIGIYYFDPGNLRLSSPGTERILTDKEAKLLEYLCRHQNQLIKRKDILDLLWKDSDFFNGRSMDVFITRLRKHLAADPGIHIESIRGIGFRFYF